MKEKYIYKLPSIDLYLILKKKSSVDTNAFYEFNPSSFSIPIYKSDFTMDKMIVSMIFSLSFNNTNIENGWATFIIQTLIFNNLEIQIKRSTPSLLGFTLITCQQPIKAWYLQKTTKQRRCWLQKRQQRENIQLHPMA